MRQLCLEARCKKNKIKKNKKHSLLSGVVCLRAMNTVVHVYCCKQTIYTDMITATQT